VIYRRLGRTEIDVSLLSVGSGGYNRFGQAKGVPESEMHRFVHHALDLGINHFDTAVPPSYGDSELILGRALADVARDRYTLSTKFAVIDSESDQVLSSERIVKHVEESLLNMQIDELDILLLGGAGMGGEFDRVMNEIRPTLEQLVRDGKVRHIGSSENSSDDGGHSWLEKAVEDELIEVVMVSYNMMNQSAERTVFPGCRKNDVGAMGIYTVRNAFSIPSRLCEVVGELKESGVLGDEVPDEDPLGWLLDDDGGEGESLASAAYRFSAANEAISTVVCGTIDIAHLEANVMSIEKPPLSAEKMARLRQLFGHIATSIGN
jgi:aryl-alcohol dehydrogenase-like predicted oxidoreductase